MVSAVNDARLQALQAGEPISLSLEGLPAAACDLFNPHALDALALTGGGEPILALAESGHVEALAEELTADARVLIGRLMPGPVAALLRASPLLPEAAQYRRGNVAALVPSDLEVRALITALGRPLVIRMSDSPDLRDGPTIVDVTARPARILRAGRLDASAIGRYVLLEPEE